MEWSSFAVALRARGWIVDLRESSAHRVPEVLRRYPPLPIELVDMLSTSRRIVHSDETRWFTMLEDYDGASGLAFAWDEWERLELDAVPEERETVTQFWSRYCPFATDVRGDYYFLALDTVDRHVVDGYGPEFEAVSNIAPSFVEFVNGVATSMLDLHLLR